MQSPKNTPQSKLRSFYDKVVAPEYEVGSYEEFEQYMSDEKNRKAMYNEIGQTYDMPEYGAWVNSLYPEKKKPRQVALLRLEVALQNLLLRLLSRVRLVRPRNTISLA